MVKIPHSSGFKRPSNESILSGLTRNKQHHYMEMREAAAKIAHERGDIDPAIYTRFLHDYLDFAKKDQELIMQKHEAAKSIDVEPDARAIQRESKHRQNEFMYNFQADVLPEYGPNGRQAFNALGQEMQGPSIFSAAAEQIYDKKKGGLQIGGIIGLVVGALMARQITGGMASGAFGIISMIAGGFMVAWLGNKGADYISNMFKPTNPPVAGKDTPSQSQGTQKQAENGKGTAAPERSVDEDAQKAYEQASGEDPARLGINGGEDTQQPTGPAPTGSATGRDTGGRSGTGPL